MRQRGWIFYKIMLYLGLIAAVTLLSILCYIGFYRYTGYWKDPIVQLIGLGSFLQIIFYFSCIRLVHYYVPNRIQPDRTFSVFFILLLVINSCIALGLLLVLAWVFSEAFLGNSRPGKEAYTAFLVIGSYTFLSMYISAASVVLQRYNRYQASTDEDKWLSKLGSSPTAQ